VAGFWHPEVPKENINALYRKNYGFRSPPKISHPFPIFGAAPLGPIFDKYEGYGNGFLTNLVRAVGKVIHNIMNLLRSQMYPLWRDSCSILIQMKNLKD